MVGNWMRDYWRPMMAVQYFAVCIFDFAVAPIVWSAVQAYMHMPITQWVPTTLSQGGMYHMAMGAVLGIAAWTRGQEKAQATRFEMESPKAVVGPDPAGKNFRNE